MGSRNTDLGIYLRVALLILTILTTNYDYTNSPPPPPGERNHVTMLTPSHVSFNISMVFLLRQHCKSVVPYKQYLNCRYLKLYIVNFANRNTTIHPVAYLPINNTLYPSINPKLRIISPTHKSHDPVWPPPTSAPIRKAKNSSPRSCLCAIRLGSALYSAHRGASEA